MMFETSSESRKSWNGRKITWQCIPKFAATEENDLEVAMEVCIREHIWTKMKKIGVIVQVYTVG